MGRLRFDPGLDVYSVFNGNVVLTQNQNLESSLGRSQKALEGA